MVHSLSHIDAVARKARCSICGSTRIYSRGDGTFKCGTKHDFKTQLRSKTENGRKRSAQRTARYRENNRGKARAATSAWKKRNPGYNSKRRAIARNAFIETVDVSVLLKRQHGKCGICKKPIAKGKGFHIDHVVPLSKGGEHSMRNTQVTHGLCNMRKGITLP